MPYRVLKTLLLGLPLLVTGGCKEHIVEQLAFLPEKASDYPPTNLVDTQEVWLNAEDGVAIHSFYLAQYDSEQVILFFHGNAGNAYSRLPHAEILRNMGFNVLVVDYHGYGKSQGTPSEKGLYLDAKAAYQYAQNELGFAPDKIYLYGRSIGSTAVIDLASQHKVAGSILVAPLSSGRAMAKQMGLGWLDWLVDDVFDNLDKAKTIQSPILILHGSQDRVVPIDQGKDLFDAVASADKQFIIINDAGHNNISDSKHVDFWLTIEKFLAQ